MIYSDLEGKRIDIQDIEDILENVMLDEFHIELDDSSARQVCISNYISRLSISLD